MSRLHLGKTQLLFLIILIEGYVVLASELLAIRQLIPFVGSGTDTISIIISAVLMPLAIGYHAGGTAYARHFRKHRQRMNARVRRLHSIRSLLLGNLLTALVILSLGLSYVMLELIFGLMSAAGLTSRLLQTGLYCAIFIIYPVFLLGQTVPLVSRYFSRRKLSEITGRMLFFSTIGSFLGSVFSTIVLMSTIGVHNTVIVTMTLLAGLALLINRHVFSFNTLIIVGTLGITLALNSPDVMRALNIVSDNNYNTIMVKDLPEKDAVMMYANRSSSSLLPKDPKNRFGYMKFVEDNFITPIQGGEERPRDILVLGAGGFTFGHNDKHNRYLFVDIDKTLKDVAEKHFLREKLSPNKSFAVASARAFLNGHKEKYDLIFIDVYSNDLAVPMEVTTREFLSDVKRVLKPGGIVLSNVIETADFRDLFTVRYDNTFASVFPGFSRQIIGEFNPWSSRHKPHNVIYVYFDRKHIDDDTVYTDDLNTYSLDR